MPPKLSVASCLRRPSATACSSRFVRTDTVTTRGFSSTTANAFGLRPKRISSSGSPVLLEASKAAALLRRQLPNRCGALAYKKGMSAVYLPTGERIPCTILQLDRVQVSAVKTRHEHGYWAVQVGLGWRAPKNVTRAMLGHYEVCGVAPKQLLREFRVKDETGLLKPGTVITADHFIMGQYVDVRADSKGKGFAGGMKRHGWGGQPASHGNSLTHRAMGSAGGSQGSGSRVHPGKRMPGRMGGNQHTVQNLKVLQVVPELGIVVISGAVSGPKGCVVELQDAIKKDPIPVSNTAA